MVFECVVCFEEGCRRRNTDDTDANAADSKKHKHEAVRTARVVVSSRHPVAKLREAFRQVVDLDRVMDASVLVAQHLRYSGNIARHVRPG